MDSVGDLERLARSFERHLRAENKSPKTVTAYGESVTQLWGYLAVRSKRMTLRWLRAAHGWCMALAVRAVPSADPS